MSSRCRWPSFKLITLGCKVNQYDSQRMREAMEDAGLHACAGGEPPGLVVINTCTVTRGSDDKCRQCIRRAVREHPDALVVVAGCYVSRDRAAVEAIPGVHAALANHERDRIAALAAEVAAEGKLASQPERGIRGFAGHTRAFLKIQDGCDAFCSYCIVPHVRGPVRSRPLPDVVEEVQRLALAGFREVVLCGIHLGAYGRDLGGRADLAGVVCEVLRSTDVERMRLSSVEALEVSNALLEAMAFDDRVCPHLHLPLQSGDDEVLRRMNRRYTRDQFLGQVRSIRRVLDRPALTADVMVGFPGESEEQFQRTVSTCREAGFGRMHVFPFSPREGTPAAELPDPCSPLVIGARKEALAAVAADLQQSFEREWVAATGRVLFEHRRHVDSGKLRGYTERYIHVLAEGDDALMGRIVPVRLTKSYGGLMDGVVE